MRVISAHFTTIDGTAASEGRAGAHSVVADRPAGVAGGQGLGFNGGELLALAVGGCLCNDLRYVAARRAIELDPFAVDVDVEIDEKDGSVARVKVVVDAGTGRAAVAEVFDAALADSTIVRAVINGAPLEAALA